MPLILNNRLLTFLHISFKNHPKINIFIVFAYTAALAVGFASEQRPSKAGRVVFARLIVARHGSSCYSAFVPKRPGPGLGFIPRPRDRPKVATGFRTALRSEVGDWYLQKYSCMLTWNVYLNYRHHFTPLRCRWPEARPWGGCFKKLSALKEAVFRDRTQAWCYSVWVRIWSWNFYMRL